MQLPKHKYAGTILDTFWYLTWPPDAWSEAENILLVYDIPAITKQKSPFL